jgi:hypothetical protein
MTWPSLSYVAEDAKGRVVGYVLAKMCVLYILPSLAGFDDDALGRKILHLEMSHMDT